MSGPSVHDDWLSLIEISGPFLAVPVLKEAFPQGLEELDATKRKRLRQAYEEWREALELEDAQFAELHTAWIDEVLSRGLELDEDGKGDVLKRTDWCAANLKASLPEHGVTLSPDLAVIDEQRANKPLLLIQSYAQAVDLDATLKQDGWAATPADRMVQLCRSLGCRLGLVTNGERWMLVDAPVGAVTTFASWYARIWSQEPITLQAFVHLLGIRRFFVDEAEQLPALFDRSLKFQDEVTDALGEQVRRAVEVLIQTLDKADQDRNRELLHEVKEPELYEAALTVMMRLVFLLSAEERGLLLMGDERYEANYALSTLRMQLRKESEEILERRWDAWSRLLAIFRAVFGGIKHENLCLPALGGSLFDPDRFPFLEGRAKGSNWRTDAAKPLPIDNRTVLLLLEAIQQFQGRTLSYRALDVEQIGYVYEGLLERTVKRTDEVTLDLTFGKDAKKNIFSFDELEQLRNQDEQTLVETLSSPKAIKRAASAITNDLAKPVDDTLADRLLTACQGDTNLRDRVKPYAHLLRTDPWGYPLVYPAGAFIVTTGSDRRETGTHYTPKSLTEAIVAETLTPVAYVGPAEGTPRDQWALKSPAELLDLKICDPAMGSGAFLVQACRWLSDRLVEAWSLVEATGKTVSVDGEVLEAGAAKEPLPRDSEARTVIARRLIAERCLYGVDLNPLAVELAKLSIWLVTLAKGRPFGFLDHNLRSGDSLLGIQLQSQLIELSMTPGGKGQQRLFSGIVKDTLKEVTEIRLQLRNTPIRDIFDVEKMGLLNKRTELQLTTPEQIADAFVSLLFDGRSGANLESSMTRMEMEAGQAIEGDEISLNNLALKSNKIFSDDLPIGKSARQPFHWPLSFPEVFSDPINPGFDAVIGNPPFKRGKDITAVTGAKYRDYLVNFVANGVRGSADLVVYFLLRGFSLLRSRGTIGLITTKTISEGDSKDVGLQQLTKGDGVVYCAEKLISWPGDAQVIVSRIHLFRGTYLGQKTLDGSFVSHISDMLTSKVEWNPVELANKPASAYQGVITHGDGFEIDGETFIQHFCGDEKYKHVVLPYLNGDDISKSPSQSASRYIVTFWDWPKSRDKNGSWFDMQEQARKKSLTEGVVPRDYPGPVAEDYPKAYEIVEKLVRPHRQEKKSNGDYKLRKPLPQRWWQYADKRPGMYADLGLGAIFSTLSDKWPADVDSENTVIVRVQTTKHHSFSVVPAFQIINNTINVIASSNPALFAVLSSEIHASWFYKYGSNLGVAGKQSVGYPRYFHTAVYGTFPFCELTQDLSVLGRRLIVERAEIFSRLQIGITQFYNEVHDPKSKLTDAINFRELLQALEFAVAKAYGWSDLLVGLDFRENEYLPKSDRLRFTFTKGERDQILQRLENMNQFLARGQVVTADVHQGNEV